MIYGLQVFDDSGSVMLGETVTNYAIVGREVFTTTSNDLVIDLSSYDPQADKIFILTTAILAIGFVGTSGGFEITYSGSSATILNVGIGRTLELLILRSS
ncbi:hypothetical protein M316_0115 [Nitrincola phage 1M3-16]|uniref:hypothetical protein n=1 Tax=Nitrincola phage 1M3-16 TaxID=1472912 RepID=UPI000444B914|nr:hypothetical protein GJ22_gp037 [Nitrincola phage 1M3-16]AHX01180.1 hypothetical protein M316_0115 [Nitrincola phage 1M3-16]